MRKPDGGTSSPRLGLDLIDLNLKKTQMKIILTEWRVKVGGKKIPLSAWSSSELAVWSYGIANRGSAISSL